MASVALDAVFDPLPEVAHNTLQQRSINNHDVLTNGILQVVQITGLVSIHTILQIPPQKKSEIDRSGDLGGHGTSPKREMRFLGNILRTTFIDALAVCAVAPSC